MEYPHRLSVTRAAGTVDGYFDSDTGAWVPAAGVYPVSLYDDAADVQDKGTVIARDQSGLPTLTADATAYLADESKVSGFKPGDVAVIDWNDGTTADAEVVRAVRLDGAVHLRFL